MCSIVHNASYYASAFCIIESAMHELMDAAARLKDAREAAGYGSAKAAAEAMGVSVATYIQHENGTRGYPASKAERYARFFRKTPEWLLYGRKTGILPQPAPPELPVSADLLSVVLSEYLPEMRKLNWLAPEGKRLAQRIAHALALLKADRANLPSQDAVEVAVRAANSQFPDERPQA